jgi:hypothetical protein
MIMPSTRSGTPLGAAGRDGLRHEGDGIAFLVQETEFEMQFDGFGAEAFLEGVQKTSAIFA